jgi:hypothetical protein
MRAYRCYFLNLHSRIEGVEFIEAETDAEALQQAEVVFREKGAGFSGVEVWDGGRHVHREIDHSLEQIRRWRMKAEELRMAADGFTNHPAGQQFRNSAETYEALANHSEARLQAPKGAEARSGVSRFGGDV